MIGYLFCLMIEFEISTYKLKKKKIYVSKPIKKKTYKKKVEFEISKECHSGVLIDC